LPLSELQRCYEDAVTFHRVGRTDEALDLAKLCLAGDFELKQRAVVLVGELLLRSGRLQNLSDHVQEFSDHVSDPRFALVAARLLIQQEAISTAREHLLQLKDQTSDKRVARAAAFELVGLLDRQGSYAEAWETATAEHRRSTGDYPVELLEKALFVTATAAQQAGKLNVQRASNEVFQTAFLTGVPRSGTSLLEQMLDRHSKISGIGENSIPGGMADAIAAQGRGWPSGAQSVPTKILNSWQERYQELVRNQLAVPKGCWSIDKTLFPMFQPLAIGCVLPGSRVVRIVRDPRDTAVSLFLSNFDTSWGWTGSLKAIERVIAAERTFVPYILQSLQIPSVELQYERLVEKPKESLMHSLELLGLEFEEACLHPEQNPRVVMTLSNQQVRISLNPDAIGRWRNYEKFLKQSGFMPKNSGG